MTMRREIERALVRATTCRTQHGRFTIGPTSRITEFDLEVDLDQKAGSFFTRALDLVTRASDYNPNGVLVWLPALDVLASWDCSHTTLFLFPGVRIAEILDDPAPFLTAQWDHERGVRVKKRERHFDLVPRDLDKQVFAAFDTGAQKRAIKTWRPIFERYPSLEERLSFQVHCRAVDLQNDAVDGNPDAITTLDALAAFIPAIAPGLDLEELAEARAFIETRLRDVLGHRLIEKDYATARRIVEAYLRNLPKTGDRKLREEIASQAMCLAVIERDAKLFRAIAPLVPKKLTDPVLAFNLACYHAVMKHETEMLELVRTARKLGKRPSEFEDDADFAPYLDDPAFRARLK